MKVENLALPIFWRGMDYFSVNKILCYSVLFYFVNKLTRGLSKERGTNETGS